MKSREFMHKHKVLLYTIPLIITAIILLFVCAFAKPVHAIAFFDISDEQYSKDLLAEFDDGKDITQYKNTIKLAEYTSNATDNYFVWFSSDYYKYIYNNLNYLYSASIDDETFDKKSKENMSNARIIESTDVEGVKVEFYAASNIQSSDHVKDLFKIDFIYDTFDISKTTEKTYDEYGNLVSSTSESIKRDALLIFSHKKSWPIVWNNQPNYSVASEKLIQYSYIAIITHNPSVTILPANAPV